jgi:hypothetical protein
MQQFAWQIAKQRFQESRRLFEQRHGGLHFAGRGGLHTTPPVKSLILLAIIIRKKK